MPAVAAEPNAAVVTPSSGAVPALAWTAFFAFAASGLDLRTGGDVGCVLVSLVCGVVAIVWLLRRVGGRRGGVSAWAHRWIILVALLALGVAAPYAPRLQADAVSLWANWRTGTLESQPIRSAAELEALAPRRETRVRLVGQARCEVLPQLEDTRACRHLRWGGENLPTFERPVDPLADAVLTVAYHSLGGAIPLRDALRAPHLHGGAYSRQLVRPQETIDTTLKVCGPEAPPRMARDARDACDRLKLALQTGLWGYNDQMELLDALSWPTWMERGASLQVAYMRTVADWQGALFAVVHEREQRNLTALLDKVRTAQRGGVVLFLEGLPSQPAGVRWPQSGLEHIVDRTAVDRVLALTTRLDPFEVQGRVIGRVALPGQAPVYRIDADRPPMSVAQSLLAVSLAAWAALLLVGHGLALLWSDIRIGSRR